MCERNFKSQAPRLRPERFWNRFEVVLLIKTHETCLTWSHLTKNFGIIHFVCFPAGGLYSFSRGRRFRKKKNYSQDILRLNCLLLFHCAKCDKVNWVKRSANKKSPVVLSGRGQFVSQYSLFCCDRRTTIHLPCLSIYLMKLKLMP